jgi:hypothetical protein
MYARGTTVREIQDVLMESFVTGNLKFFETLQNLNLRRVP